MKNKKIKDVVLEIVVLTLVGGTLILSVIDKSHRSSFIDLAKIGVGSYIGLRVSKSTSEIE